MAKPSKVELRARERREELAAEFAEADAQADALAARRSSLVEQIGVLDGILDVPADEGDGGADDA